MIKILSPERKKKGDKALPDAQLTVATQYALRRHSCLAGLG